MVVLNLDQHHTQNINGQNKGAMQSRVMKIFDDYKNQEIHAAILLCYRVSQKKLSLGM